MRRHILRHTAVTYKNLSAPMTKGPPHYFVFSESVLICVFTCIKYLIPVVLVLLAVAFIRPREQVLQESIFLRGWGGDMEGLSAKCSQHTNQLDQALQLCKCLSNGRQASCGENRGGSDFQKSLCNTSQLYIRPQPSWKPEDLCELSKFR